MSAPNSRGKRSRTEQEPPDDSSEEEIPKKVAKLRIPQKKQLDNAAKKWIRERHDVLSLKRKSTPSSSSSNVEVQQKHLLRRLPASF